MKNRIYSFFRKSDDEDEMNLYNLYESHFIVKFFKVCSKGMGIKSKIKTQKGIKKPEGL
ncbi:hypothetical protein ACSSUQ_004240 [Yersinia enterocolitica]